MKDKTTQHLISELLGMTLDDMRDVNFTYPDRVLQELAFRGVKKVWFRDAHGDEYAKSPEEIPYFNRRAKGLIVEFSDKPFPPNKTTFDTSTPPTETLERIKEIVAVIPALSALLLCRWRKNPPEAIAKGFCLVGVCSCLTFYSHNADGKFQMPHDHTSLYAVIPHTKGIPFTTSSERSNSKYPSSIALWAAYFDVPIEAYYNCNLPVRVEKFYTRFHGGGCNEIKPQQGDAPYKTLQTSGGRLENVSYRLYLPPAVRPKFEPTFASTYDILRFLLGSGESETVNKAIQVLSERGVHRVTVEVEYGVHREQSVQSLPYFSQAAVQTVGIIKPLS